MEIRNIKTYPNNGKHQIVVTDLPFSITKGLDTFYYYRKGKEYCYNNGKETTTKWICQLKDDANVSLKRIFEIKVTKTVEAAFEYCEKLYIRSLKLEIERLKKELKNYEQ